MRNLSIGLPILILLAAPAVAQTAPAHQPQTEKPKKVEKLVCKQVQDEATIGSRFGPKSKVCKKVTVPAPEEDSQQGSPGAVRNTR